MTLGGQLQRNRSEHGRSNEIDGFKPRQLMMFHAEDAEVRFTVAMAISQLV